MLPGPASGAGTVRRSRPVCAPEPVVVARPMLPAVPTPLVTVPMLLTPGEGVTARVVAVGALLSVVAALSVPMIVLDAAGVDIPIPPPLRVPRAARMAVMERRLLCRRVVIRLCAARFAIWRLAEWAAACAGVGATRLSKRPPARMAASVVRMVIMVLLCPE